MKERPGGGGVGGWMGGWGAQFPTIPSSARFPSLTSTDSAPTQVECTGYVRERGRVAQRAFLFRAML